MNNETEPTTNNDIHERIEDKSVKHTFTMQEREAIGSDLARAIGNARGIAAEFDQIKAGYKARTTEAEAKIENLSTSLANGFEYRKKRCVVVLDPKTRKKYFYLEDAGEDDAPVLVEDMTAKDFQADLFYAESKFQNKRELELFPAAGSDYGRMVVGELGGKWFAALRVRIGRNQLEERLDSEQPCSVERIDMITLAGDRFLEWVKQTLGNDAAKGMSEHFWKLIETEKEKAE